MSYISNQISGIKCKTGMFSSKPKVKLTSEFGETNWMDIDFSDVDDIEMALNSKYSLTHVIGDVVKALDDGVKIEVGSVAHEMLKKILNGTE